MIRETIVTTQGPDGTPKIAPMGIHVVSAKEFLIMPFRPSMTLDNILATRCAVINYCEDVRVFAGCITGHGEWPLTAADKVAAPRLLQTLAHAEVELTRVEDHPERPWLHCNVVHEVNHAPFHGFNRAQTSVIEASILVSRLHLLPWSKIQHELDYLRIGLEKTAGDRETEAWGWLMEKVATWRASHPDHHP